MGRVGYIRVSTASGEQLEALEGQRSRIEASGVDRIIQDIQSGRDSDRDGLQELLELMAGRAIEEVVFTRVDRLGRDAADTDSVIAFAARKGVKLTALDGGSIESETPAGFFMSRIMTTMAEVESRMLSKRIRDGLIERRKKGYPCRGRAAWGYRISPDRKSLEPDPVEWPRAQQFLQLLEANRWRMNTTLTDWHRQERGPIPLSSCRAVRAWLLNPSLRGGLGYNQLANHRFKEVFWDTHPALLSHAKFADAERQLAANRHLWGKNTVTRMRLLTGLCICCICNKRMTYAGGRTIASMLCKTRGCPQQYKSTHESHIASAIARALAHHADELALTSPSEEPPEVTELRLDIESLTARNDPDLAGALRLKNQRLAALLTRSPFPPEQAAALRDPLVYANATYEELTDLYHQLVDRVLITNQEVAQVILRF